MVPLRPGQVVTSKKGRDEGRHYLVMRVDPRGFVWLTDGWRRPQARPKRKNWRHVWVEDGIAHELGRRWEKGERVPDGDVRETLERLAPRPAHAAAADAVSPKEAT
ncbi:MAG TPA: KOW domain-containing RNA-binding protein [Limnochordia bacterium]